MPSLRIILEPEQQGIGDNFQRAALDGTLIHLGDDAEVVVSGLERGMASGAPSMMFGFALPDGRCVIAETSWRLFSAAYMAFAGKFGVDQPDASGITLEYDATGGGQRVRLDLIADDAPQFFECQVCGDRVDEPAGVDGAVRITQWVHRHFREKHPTSPVPEVN